MGLPTLPYINTAPKIIFFSDFDGTITLGDSNDFLIDNLGYGKKKRREGNIAVLEGKKTFRDAFQNMMDSVKIPFNECVDAVRKNIKLDPHFAGFYEWTKENNVPVVILSAGMKPIIETLLQTALDLEPESGSLHVVSNNVTSRQGRDINTEGGWQVKFHDDSHHGHDKSLEIKPYATLPSNDRPILLYAGDGGSDLSAARETDILFAKDGHVDLAKYCEQEGLPFIPFKDFSDILEVTKDIYSGNMPIRK